MGVTVRKGIEIDDSALIAHLHDYSLVLGKDMAEVIREQAGLFCQDMIKYSRPFAGKAPGSGDKKTAKDTGDNNVMRSIRKIFRSVDQADPEMIASLGRYDVFKMWTKRKGETVQGKGKAVRWERFKEKYGKGTSYAFIPPGSLGLMEQVHRKLRIDGGRGSLSPAARSAQKPFAIVAKDKDIERYTKRVQKDVGMLKSAYYHAAMLVRSKCAGASWVKHSEGRTNAIARDEGQKPNQPEMTVGNMIGKRAGNDRFVRMAISYRAYAMRVAMAARLNKEKTPLWLATAQGKTVNVSKFF
jgi:hypothetical protein